MIREICECFDCLQRAGANKDKDKFSCLLEGCYYTSMGLIRSSRRFELTTFTCWLRSEVVAAVKLGGCWKLATADFDMGTNCEYALLDSEEDNTLQNLDLGESLQQASSQVRQGVCSR
jgi:hypothetical protein